MKHQRLLFNSWPFHWITIWCIVAVYHTDCHNEQLFLLQCKFQVLKQISRNDIIYRKIYGAATITRRLPFYHPNCTRLLFIFLKSSDTFSITSGLAATSFILVINSGKVCIMHRYDPQACDSLQSTASGAS